MTLVKQLRTWDEMPNDDDKAFHWLDLKTAEAADEIGWAALAVCFFGLMFGFLGA